jgi:outer membrane protein assembly factor BamA
VFARAEQPRYLYTETSVTSDTRDQRGHPTRGGLYRAAWSAYSDRDAGTFSFRRYEAEGARFVPLARNLLVVAVHGWLVATDTAAGRTVPFYLMPSLGGNNTLRGYTDYRFHDRHLVLFTTEARVAVFTHLDAAAFVDAGNVAARVRDLDLGKRSYGVGLRLHGAGTTFARFDVARATEGWRFVFRMNDPLRLSRWARRTAPVPFAP